MGQPLFQGHRLGVQSPHSHPRTPQLLREGKPGGGEGSGGAALGSCSQGPARRWRAWVERRGISAAIPAHPGPVGDPGKRTLTPPHGGFCLWPRFLPVSHHAPVPVQGALARPPGNGSSSPSSISSPAAGSSTPQVTKARGSSFGGGQDALSPAVLPLVLLFLPPPAHSGWTWEPGCAVARGAGGQV